VGLSPRQLRNQPGTKELPAQLPQSSADGLEAAITAAKATSMRDNAKRQAQAKNWMDRGLGNPAPSGDRGPTAASHAGHVGDVLGTGVAPGAEPPLLPQAQTNNRLPDPPPAPPAVSSSGTRPKGMAGLVFNWRPAPAAVAGPQATTQGVVTYVGVDEPGGRSGGLVAFVRRLFGGPK